MKTIKAFDKTITKADESLSLGEFTAMNNELSIEAYNLRQEKIETILDVQLFLSDIKDAIRGVYVVLSPVIEIIYDHLSRLTDMKNIIFEALENNFSINNLKLDVITYM